MSDLHCFQFPQLILAVYIRSIVLACSTFLGMTDFVPFLRTRLCSVDRKNTFNNDVETMLKSSTEYRYITLTSFFFVCCFLLFLLMTNVLSELSSCSCSEY